MSSFVLCVGYEGSRSYQADNPVSWGCAAVLNGDTLVNPTLGRNFSMRDGRTLMSKYASKGSLTLLELEIPIPIEWSNSQLIVVEIVTKPLEGFPELEFLETFPDEGRLLCTRLPNSLVMLFTHSNWGHDQSNAILRLVKKHPQFRDALLHAGFCLNHRSMEIGKALGFNPRFIPKDE